MLAAFSMCYLYNPFSLFLFLSVVDIVAFGRFHVLFKVVNAVFYQEVIPLNQFLDVAVVNTVAVEAGQNLGKVFTQFVAACFLVVEAGNLAFLQVLQVGENLI